MNILQPISKPRTDTKMFALILALVGSGVTFLFSSSYWRAELLFADPYYFFRRQLMWIALGGGVAVVLAKIELTYIRKKIPWILLVTLVLLLVTFVDGIGVSYLGARRWLSLFGLSFQPSELAKLSLILYLALVLDNKAEKLDNPWNSIFPPLVVVALFSTIIYMQNDFSTAVFMVILAIGMFFIGGVRIRYFVILFITSIPLALISILSQEYRVERIISFLFPTLDPQGSGYQLLSAHSALRHGSWWGTGIGLSIHKQGELPEAHSDFIFAVIAEEVGLIGAVVILLLFVSFAIVGIDIAKRCRHRFHSFLAAGITLSIVMQALSNIAVICGIIPTTGIPLPFFSAGGSSMLITLIMCGLLLNISRISREEQ